MPHELIATSGTTEWRRFRPRAARTRYGRNDACLEAPARPLSFVLGAKRPKRLLYITKESFLRMWSAVGRLPDEVALCCQEGIPSWTYCEALKQHSEWLKLPLLFVGDLDPLDLTIFATLVCGNPELRPSPSTAPSVRYLGINDSWLKLCRTNLSRQHRELRTVTIEMRKAEREHYEVVKRIFPRLEQLVGAECFRLLESGQKLELEGAANPGIYGRSFTRRLGQLLLSA